MPIVPIFPDVAPVPPPPVIGAWTQVGGVNFIGCVPQTFTTTGTKTVTLASGATATVSATMSVGTITTGSAGSDATRGLIADVPVGVASTAYQLRTTVPVSPSIAVTDDLLCVVKWRGNLGTGTNQRALVGLTTSIGTEGTAGFSGLVLQNTATNVVKLQTRKDTAVADTVASVPTGMRDGTTLMQSEVRIVGALRTHFTSTYARPVNSGIPTYIGDIGSNSTGPDAGLGAPLFNGAAVYVMLYSWNGAASGGSSQAAIEEIVVYARPSYRVP